MTTKKCRHWANRLLAAAIIVCSTAQLTACGSLMQEKKNKYELQSVKVGDLAEDTYYVKEGTDFYEAYAASGTATGIPSKVDDQRLVWLQKDASLVPTLYKGEVIAYSSSKTELTSAPLERFRDIGYSIGIYGMTFDSSSSPQFDYQLKNVVKDSSAYEVMSDDKSDSFSISSINGQAVTKGMANGAGVLTCMEANKDYSVEYYSGTYYKKQTFTASTHMLQAFELYSIDSIEQTKNGYVEIKLPEDLKTGWYMIGGKGLFKYIDHERNSVKAPEGDEWNSAYYASNDDTHAYAQKYSISFDKATTDATIKVSLDPTTIGDGGVYITATSPDGHEYELAPTGTNTGAAAGISVDAAAAQYTDETGQAYSDYDVTIKEAVAGKWYVYVAPKTVTVTNVSVESAAHDEEATEVDQAFTLDDDEKNKTFVVSYDGDGDIHASLIATDGQAYDLVLDKDNKKLTYPMEFLPKGVYTVKAYHYTDTDITGIKMEDTTTDADEDIITVTE